MLDHEPFIETILDHPGDDGPKLVYADWLEERGDPRADWLRLSIRNLSIARSIRIRPDETDDVRTWRDRLTRPGRPKQLMWIWTCSLIRSQPLSHDRRLGDILSRTNEMQVLALADLRSCGLLSSTRRKKSKLLALKNLKQKRKGLDRLSSLACQAIYHVLRGGWIDATELTALAADISGVPWRMSNRWQVALARELLEQPAAQWNAVAQRIERTEHTSEHIAVSPGNTFLSNDRALR
jgi:uncharacterized protein (TIGR02996 family)